MAAIPADRQQRDGAVDLGVQVQRPVAARQLACLAERLVRGLAHSSDCAGRPIVTALGKRRGELGLDGDRRELATEHVVHVAGEAQPLLGDRQRCLGARARSSSVTTPSSHSELCTVKARKAAIAGP